MAPLKLGVFKALFLASMHKEGRVSSILNISMNSPSKSTIKVNRVILLSLIDRFSKDPFKFIVFFSVAKATLQLQMSLRLFVCLFVRQS